MASTGRHTTAAKQKIAQAYANSLGFWNANAERMRLSFFRVGEGGVQTPGSGVLSPIDSPDPSLTNIQAPTKSVYFFEKALEPADVSETSGVVTITVSLASGEGESPNGVFPNPAGNPAYSEVGIFDEAGTLVLYFTFPPEEKTPSSTWTKTFNINLAP